MGYELETPTPAVSAEVGGDRRRQVLERRWLRANDRLAVALAGYRALHGRVAADDPAWLGAQLRLAQARQCCREASDGLELYAIECARSALRR